MKTINATTAVCTSTSTPNNDLFVTTTKEVGLYQPRAIVEIIGAEVHLHEKEYIDDVLYEEWRIEPSGQAVIIITSQGERERFTYIPNWGWREDYYVEGRGWCRR